LAVDPHRLLLGGDIDGTVLSPDLALKRALGAWVFYEGLGGNGAASIGQIPVLTLESLLSHASVAPAAIQWIVVLLHLILTPVGMAFYTAVVFRDNKLVVFVSTLAVFFNLYVAVTNNTTPYLAFDAALAAGPLLAAAILCLGQSFRLRNVMLLLLAAIVTAEIGANAAGALLAFVTALILAVAGARELRMPLSRLTAPCAMLIGLNGYWIVSTIHYVIADGARIAASEYALRWGESTLRAISDSASPGNVVRLVSTWEWLHADEAGRAYTPFAPMFSHSRLLFSASFLPASLALVGAIAYPRRLSPYALCALVFLFLMKGTAPPLGGLYDFLYHHLPGFQVFRDPYTKFGIGVVPALAILAAFGVQFLSTRVDSAAYRTAVVAACVALILVTPYHYWTGHMFKREGYPMDDYVVMPPGYAALANYLNEQHDQKGRVIVFPFSPALSYTALRWGFVGPDPLRFMIARPTVFEVNGFADPYVGIAFHNIDRSNNALRRAADRLSVKYIVVHRDVDTAFYGADRYDDIRRLIADTGARHVRSFGELELYELGPALNRNGYSLVRFEGAPPFVHDLSAQSLYWLGNRTLTSDPAPAPRAPDGVIVLPNHITSDIVGAVPPLGAGGYVLDGQLLTRTVAADAQTGRSHLTVLKSIRSAPARSPALAAQIRLPVTIQPGDRVYGLTYEANMKASVIGSRFTACPGTAAQRDSYLKLDGLRRGVAFEARAETACPGSVLLFGDDLGPLFHSQLQLFSADVSMREDVVLPEAVLTSWARLPPAVPVSNVFTPYKATGPSGQVSVLDRDEWRDQLSVMVYHPGVIAFATAANGDWRATQQEATLRPVLVDGVLNGWYVPAAGPLTLSYGAADLRTLGLAMSVLSLLFGVAASLKGPHRNGACP